MNRDDQYCRAIASLVDGPNFLSPVDGTAEGLGARAAVLSAGLVSARADEQNTSDQKCAAAVAQS
jgi:hypothetical protein